MSDCSAVALVADQETLTPLVKGQCGECARLVLAFRCGDCGNFLCFRCVRDRGTQWHRNVLAPHEWSPVDGTWKHSPRKVGWVARAMDWLIDRTIGAAFKVGLAFSVAATSCSFVPIGSSSASDRDMRGEEAYRYIVAFDHHELNGPPMIHRPAHDVELIPEDELAGDPEALAAIQAAANRMTEVTGLKWQLGVDAPVKVRLRIVGRDLGSDWRAWTVMGGSEVTRAVTSPRYNLRTQEIADVDIYFHHRSDVTPRVVLHEFGHALGLEHSYDKRDLMFAGAGRRVNDFSPREVALIRWLMQQEPGTVPEYMRQQIADR